MVITVADRAADADGLWSGDFDLLARLPNLGRIDVVATVSMLDTGFRERLHDLLPGIEETRVEASAPSGPRLITPVASSGERHFTFRDREEELLAVIRQVKRRSSSERTAVVFQRPLPYLYVAGQLFASAGVPFATRDTLPLAAEPFAAANDLVLTFVSSGYARIPTGPAGCSTVCSVFLTRTAPQPRWTPPPRGASRGPAPRSSVSSGTFATPMCDMTTQWRTCGRCDRRCAAGSRR